MRVAIVGGGPGGLMAAGSLPRGIEALVFENGPRPGRKLLLTGSGQCNFTHQESIEDFLPHYDAGGRFLRQALHAFSPEDTIDFFRRRGVTAEIRENHKVFPATGRARDILEALLQAASGIRILTSTRVREIRSEGDGFTLPAGEEEFPADRVVIATGGLSYPFTGSTGDGMEMARRLGHSLVPPRPALCGICSSGLSVLAGKSLPAAALSLYREGRLLRKDAGALLFTHTGLSGPVILNMSRHIRPEDKLLINLLYPEKPESFLSAFPHRVKERGAGPMGAFLGDFPLPRRLSDFILTRAGLSRNRRRGDLRREEIRRLGELLVRFPVPVERLEGFDTAMVTAGGVSLKEVNPKTMESRIVPGLYFAGEVLDIDGDTGGYNLQAAFSTGYLAARSIAEGA